MKKDWQRYLKSLIRGERDGREWYTENVRDTSPSDIALSVRLINLKEKFYSFAHNFNYEKTKKYFKKVCECYEEMLETLSEKEDAVAISSLIVGGTAVDNGTFKNEGAVLEIADTMKQWYDQFKDYPEMVEKMEKW